jgi:hypothetical protein
MTITTANRIWLLTIGPFLLAYCLANVLAHVVFWWGREAYFTVKDCWNGVIEFR